MAPQQQQKQLKNIEEVKSKDKFRLLVGRSPPTVACFFASWANQCAPIEDAVAILAEELPEVLFLRVEAEESPDIAIEFEVMAVPTVLLFRSGKLLTRLEGSKAAEVSKAVKDLAKDSKDRATIVDPSSSSTPRGGASDKLLGRSPTLEVASSPSTAKPRSLAVDAGVGDGGNSSSSANEELNKRLKALIGGHPCILFMKGRPEEPKCGFSRQIVEILDGLKADYKTFDILQDDEVRQGLKVFSNWPTYPQLYVNGELIGGVDIVKEMAESKELQAILPAIPSKPAASKVDDRLAPGSGGEDQQRQEAKKAPNLNDRLKALIGLHEVMVFMKGLPEEPKCGFSRTLVEILKETGVAYKTFDILKDEEVRQGLKVFSNWPTYPQVYVKGELVGGLDIIKELRSSGELLQTLKGA